MNTIKTKEDMKLMLDESSRELNILDNLIESIAREIDFQRNLNHYDSVINADSVAPLRGVNPAARINLLNELKRRAYGKVVTVKTTNDETIQYRLAQAAEVSMVKGYDKSGLMVIGRLAPIARELIPAEVGDEVDLFGKGKGVVISTSLLDRYECGELDNFSELVYDSQKLLDDDKDELIIENVRRTVEKWQTAINEGMEWPFETQSDSESIEHVFTENSNASLGSSFYTRTTKVQEAIINRPNRGLVIVEGIAGSGKTSVALGRVKAMHSAYQLHDEDERYDDFFKDQSRMVGFVLHKQLINYLEKTLNELDLPNMKVKEFKELQNELIRFRGGLLDLQMPGNPKGTFKRVQKEVFPFEVTIKWLRAVEKQLTLNFISRISQKITNNTAWIAGISEKDIRMGKLRVDYSSIMNIAWNAASKKFATLQISISNSKPKSFLSRKLASRLKSVYEYFFDLVSENSIWYYYEGAWHLEKKAGKDIIQTPLNPFSGKNVTKMDQKWLKELRDRARTYFRQSLFMDATVDHMPKLSNWYGEILSSDEIQNEFGHDNIKQIQDRINQNELSDSDLNLLLAIAQIMSESHQYSQTDQKRIAAYISSSSNYSTVFIDEVQDFNEIEVFLMSEQADSTRKAVTVVGDFKQQLYSNKVNQLSSCFPYANDAELEIEKLMENKRQTKNLANFSAHFRAKIEKEFAENIPEAIFGDELTEETVDSTELNSYLLEKIRTIPGNQSVAVICPTLDIAKNLEQNLRDEINAIFRESLFSEDNRDLNKQLYIHFTVPKPTKGLEFDVVLAPYFNQFKVNDNLDSNSAYVTITRAKKNLHIVNVA